MNILFIHQNFPGQFKHLAPALARQGHTVVALLMRPVSTAQWQGVHLVRYPVDESQASAQVSVHPWVSDFNTKTIRGQACLRAALKLNEQGFKPDFIVAHPGWGESLFLKDLWPQARLGMYCEFYYQAQGADVGFDPEFAPPDAFAASRLRLRNINNLLHFEIADAGLSPTLWQASTFPSPFRERISVAHDGIDTSALQPRADALFSFTAASGTRLSLSRQDEVVTYVSRNLEPYRGYHILMRALPELLRQRPRAQVVIVGGDGVSYGSAPDPRVHGQASWKTIFEAEVQPLLSPADRQRIHFVGKLVYADYVALLQVSAVHVYLTYPFVLSWSLLEAMSLGCAIVASRTAPVQEVIHHNETGRLVDFFDAAALATETAALLADPETRQRLGANARQWARQHHDLNTVCLPAQLQWVAELSRLPSRKS